jgi:hypothetical protein
MMVDSMLKLIEVHNPYELVVVIQPHMVRNLVCKHLQKEVDNFHIEHSI